MTTEQPFRDHWVHLDPERIDRAEAMYRWTSASERFYEPARIGPGQAVCDFGCGPGHTAVELAKRVGRSGHVHAMDINAEFVERTRAKAAASGLDDRITAHLLEDSRLPLADGCIDRAVARNTLIYVPDPVETLAEFRRVLRPGGIAHAIEGDWGLTAVEPVPTAKWHAVVKAASWAWQRPEMGRQLFGVARRAGFEDVSVQVLTSPDTDGRLDGMIRTVADYARDGGGMDFELIDAVLRVIDKAREDGTYLAIAPQFIVTAVAPMDS